MIIDGAFMHHYVHQLSNCCDIRDLLHRSGGETGLIEELPCTETGKVNEVLCQRTSSIAPNAVWHSRTVGESHPGIQLVPVAIENQRPRTIRHELNGAARIPGTLHKIIRSAPFPPRTDDRHPTGCGSIPRMEITL